jgi:KUP system potassium uptake protein
MSLSALGIVFGDIGTSPLYSLKEIFSPHRDHALAITEENMLGVLSLISWSLFLIVTIKYIIIMLYADNNGEGGIFALMTVVMRSRGGVRSSTNIAITLCGVIGASLLFSDGLLTPSISVLSAVEGLQLLSPGFKDAVIPLALLVIIGLFSIQRFGTGKIGKYFGPIVFCWFAVIALLGIPYIIKNPSVLRGLSPYYACEIFSRAPTAAFMSLGSVILVMTGGEAAYADMGHFGAKPIRVAWFTVALPCLLLNYFGQVRYIASNQRHQQYQHQYQHWCWFVHAIPVSLMHAFLSFSDFLPFLLLLT